MISSLRQVITAKDLENQERKPRNILRHAMGFPIENYFYEDFFSYPDTVPNKPNDRDRMCFKCQTIRKQHSFYNAKHFDHQESCNKKAQIAIKSSFLYSKILFSANSGCNEVPFKMRLSISRSEKNFVDLVLPVVANCMVSNTNLDTVDLSSNPYFTNTNISEYYVEQELQLSLTNEKRKFPGYKLPKKGNLNITIANEEDVLQNVVRLPLDFNGLERGKRTILRYRIFKRTQYKIQGLKDSPIVKLNRKLSEIEIKVVHFKKKYYLYDSMNLLFQTRNNTANRYKSPLLVKELGSLDREKYPELCDEDVLIPLKNRNKIKLLQSSQYKLDMGYLINKCHFCDETDIFYS